jgi:hypothetical protein
MSGDSPPPVPKDYMKPYGGPAAGAGFNAIQDFQSAPNYAANTFNQFNPAFSGQNVNSGYNPQNTVQAGNWMTGFSQSMSPWVTQLFNEGFDPQGDVYGRAAHNVTEQARAGLNARGLAMSPYGAGVENQAMSDFNLDWENNKLGRMTSAAGAAGNLAGGINAGVSGGANLAGAAPQWQAAIAQALSGMGLNASTQNQQVIQDWLSYLGLASQSQNANYANQLNAWSADQQSQNDFWSGIGSTVGTIGGIVAAPFTGGASLALPMAIGGFGGGK